jgi:hypothetical protein
MAAASAPCRIARRGGRVTSATCRSAFGVLNAITSYAARRRGVRDRLTELMFGAAPRGSRSRVQDLLEDGCWHGAGDPIKDRRP